ncbi:DUF5994 family protein [Streptomyces sp. MI02-7b]|uniref:DUF5994 family protein n=1 Tax=Streptomyces sp. MI02-7b TaxID=462941 RepID=UPI0029BB37E9|nr:DUF5994 family protein [Streptomyces sp. MI02-7b]MDX3077486.1 DUF5994 family protein [Streptomyces sp. MI02-7b]
MSVILDRPLIAADGQDSSPPIPPPRLALKPAAAARGLLDGAWWPRSRDLARELPALIDTLDRRWARVTRVAVNPALWPVIPRRVSASGHVVHVGWFREQDPNKLLLLSYTTGRLDLLVIPPECDLAAATRLMAAAADPRRGLTASGLMADDELLRTAGTDRRGEAVWESEGGTPSAADMAAVPGRAGGTWT